jgi:putative transcriptional regulator
MTKREIVAELIEGFDALQDERAGKLTLRKTTVERKPPPEMTPERVRQVRMKLRVSQPVFAHKLRTEPRTVANWEQGVAKPNAQAAILLALVDRHPELLDEIAAL